MSSVGVLPEIWARGYLQEQEGLEDISLTKAHSSMGGQLTKAGNWEHSAQPAGSSQVAQLIPASFRPQFTRLFWTTKQFPNHDTEIDVLLVTNAPS